MQIITNQQTKIIEFWLTNAESQNEELRQSLLPIFADYKKQKYTVAVFCSGKADLLEKTTDLLLRNKAINISSPA